jgi:uncharacterized protein (TIGR02246 family)
MAPGAAFWEGVIIMRVIRVMFAIAVICVAAPASAQESDQEKQQEIARLGAKFLLRQEIQSFGFKYMDNLEKQDAAGVAGLYTKDGILMSSTAVALGPQAIEQFYQNEFKMGPLRRQSTLDEVSPLGSDAVIGRGEFHVTGQGRNSGTNADGHWAAVYVREGGTWKIRLLTQVRNAPTTGIK